MISIHDDTMDVLDLCKSRYDEGHLQVAQKILDALAKYSFPEHTTIVALSKNLIKQGYMVCDKLVIFMYICDTNCYVDGNAIMVHERYEQVLYETGINMMCVI